MAKMVILMMIPTPALCSCGILTTNKKKVGMMTLRPTSSRPKMSITSPIGRARIIPSHRTSNFSVLVSKDHARIIGLWVLHGVLQTNLLWR
jgi:hypothetical protein